MARSPDDIWVDAECAKYLVALDEGDFDTLAKVWDRASRNPKLAEALISIEDYLFWEQHPRIPEFSQN